MDDSIRQHQPTAPTGHDALFRAEAVSRRTTESDGNPRFIRPPGIGLFCLLIVCALMITGFFLTHSQYARKATVTGYVEPGDSIKRVLAPRPGIVERLLVTPGQQVSKGDIIAEIRLIATMDDADRETLLAENTVQSLAISQRSLEAKQDHQLKQARLNAERLTLTQATRLAEQLLALQNKKIEHLASINDAARPLFEAGRLSRLEWGHLSESLIDAKQAAIQLTADIANKQAQVRQTDIALAALEPAFRTRLSSLEEEQSRNRQQRISVLGETRISVPATVDGQIANVFVESGTMTSAQQPLVSIRPPGAPLYARLLVPSRSAGFIARGQAVHLLYDAFPYQQFGSYPATVVDISRHALLPGDAPSAVTLGVPYFEVTARIESPFVMAYGKRVPLRNGMGLSADIVLDRRALIDWLLEPLYVLRGRAV